MLNKVLLIGNLGADPELSYTPGGTAKANIRLATVAVWYTDGEKKEKTTWHRLVAWGKSAEIYAQYLTKGSLVSVEGSIDNRSWKDRDGNTRWTSEIRVEDIKFLKIKDRVEDAEEATEEELPEADADDDLPF